MSTQMVIELPDGQRIFFGGEETGLAQVSAASRALDVSKDAFQGALGSLAALVGALEASVGKMPNRPDKVELEFGASLTGKCDLWIVAGDGKAEFKVKLAWDKPKE